jgi:hypothetical protein
VRWLLVIGVALRIGGALLISLPLLLPVLRRQWMALLPRSSLYPRAPLDERELNEIVYAIAGAAFLLAGFTLQLAGYVDEFKNHWLVLAAVGAGVALACLLLGQFLIAPFLSRWLVEKARRDDASPR